MPMLLIIIAALFFLYAALIIFYTKSWREVPETLVLKNDVINFSIIIPARNEEKNIGGLLQSIFQQNYPQHLLEVIVVDDHSTDTTAEEVAKYAEIKLISLQDDAINSYKKKAIETGIAAAKNEWIICTDADCLVPENWLAAFASIIQKENAVFVAAPVSLSPSASQGGDKSNALYIFQALDFMTLQGITAGSVHKKVHSMCNGANLAYRKDVFYKVGGFAGIDNIASGDDMLLMYKIWKKYPQQISYLKSRNAVVQTEAAPDWKAFFNQRIRWASKATSYDDKRIFAVLLLVYLFNLSFLVLAIASFYNIQYFYFLLILWVSKTLVEWPFISMVSSFFNRQHLLKYFFFFQPLHIAYTIISGFLGSFGKYEWKGRKVK